MVVFSGTPQIAFYSSAYEGLVDGGQGAMRASVAGNGRAFGGAVKITEKASADVAAKLFAIEKYDQMNSEVLRRIAQMSRLG